MTSFLDDRKDGNIRVEFFNKKTLYSFSADPDAIREPRVLLNTSGSKPPDPKKVFWKISRHMKGIIWSIFSIRQGLGTDFGRVNWAPGRVRIRGLGRLS